MINILNNVLGCSMNIASVTRRVAVAPYNLGVILGCLLVMTAEFLSNKRSRFAWVGRINDLIDLLKTERCLMTKQALIVSEDTSGEIKAETLLKAINDCLVDNKLSETRLHNLCDMFRNNKAHLYLMKSIYSKENALFKKRMNSIIYISSTTCDSSAVSIAQVVIKDRQKVQFEASNVELSYKNSKDKYQTQAIRQYAKL